VVYIIHNLIINLALNSFIELYYKRLILKNIANLSRIR